MSEEDKLREELRICQNELFKCKKELSDCTKKLSEKEAHVRSLSNILQRCLFMVLFNKVPVIFFIKSCFQLILRSLKYIKPRMKEKMKISSKVWPCYIFYRIRDMIAIDSPEDIRVPVRVPQSPLLSGMLFNYSK